MRKTFTALIALTAILALTIGFATTAFATTPSTSQMAIHGQFIQTTIVTDNEGMIRDVIIIGQKETSVAPAHFATMASEMLRGKSTIDTANSVSADQMALKTLKADTAEANTFISTIIAAETASSLSSKNLETAAGTMKIVILMKKMAPEDYSIWANGGGPFDGIKQIVQIETQYQYIRKTGGTFVVLV